MKISTLSATAMIAVALATGLLAGCTININPGDSANQGGTSQSGESFSMVDLAFAQGMIPHHEQAVEMATLALATSSDPEILALATQIRDAQAPEIEQMQGWLDSSDSMMMDHDMQMGGMLSTTEMDALANSTGSKFDRLFLEGMIGHHEGAVQMAQMILNSDNAEAKALGEAIVTSQTAEVELMRELLAAR